MSRCPQSIVSPRCFSAGCWVPTRARCESTTSTTTSTNSPSASTDAVPGIVACSSSDFSSKRSPPARSPSISSREGITTCWGHWSEADRPFRQWVSEDRRPGVPAKSKISWGGRCRAARWGAWAPKVRRQFGIDHLDLDNEHRATAGSVAGPDPASVLLHDPAGDCQAEAGTPIRSHRIARVEAQKDPLLLAGWDPGPMVSDYEPRSALGPALHPHRGLATTVPVGVVRQDPCQLGQRVVVAGHRCRLDRRGQPGPAGHRLYDACQIERGPPQLVPGVCSSEGEQALHEAAHTLALGRDVNDGLPGILSGRGWIT